MLGARDADRDSKAKLLAHAAPDRAGNFGRRTEEMGATRHIRKGLIDGNSLDQGREIIEHVDGGIAQPLVVLEMAADKDQLRTQLARPPGRHTAADSERFSFVGSSEHDPAPDRNGLAAQAWVEKLLDRGIEGIEVGVEDRGCRFHPGRSAAKSEK